MQPPRLRLTRTRALVGLVVVVAALGATFSLVDDSERVNPEDISDAASRKPQSPLDFDIVPLDEEERAAEKRFDELRKNKVIDGKDAGGAKGAADPRKPAGRRNDNSGGNAKGALVNPDYGTDSDGKIVPKGNVAKDDVRAADARPERAAGEHKPAVAKDDKAAGKDGDVKVVDKDFAKSGVGNQGGRDDAPARLSADGGNAAQPAVPLKGAAAKDSAVRTFFAPASGTSARAFYLGRPVDAFVAAAIRRRASLTPAAPPISPPPRAKKARAVAKEVPGIPGLPTPRRNLMDLFWQAATTGELPPVATDHAALWEGMRDWGKIGWTPGFREGTVLEIGSGGFALGAMQAKKVHAALVLCPNGEGEAREATLGRDGMGSLETKIGAVEEDGMESVVDVLGSHPTMLFRTVFVGNLSATVGTLLPHEFERLLAKIILLGRDVIVREVKFTGKTASYFAYWPSFRFLLERAIAIAGIDAIPKEISDAAMWTSVGVRLHHIAVRNFSRAIPLEACERFTAGGTLAGSNGAEQGSCALVGVGGANTTKGQAPLESTFLELRGVRHLLANATDAIPLDALLSVPLVHADREALFTVLLDRLSSAVRVKDDNDSPSIASDPFAEVLSAATASLHASNGTQRMSGLLAFYRRDAVDLPLRWRLLARGIVGPFADVEEAFALSKGSSVPMTETVPGAPAAVIVPPVPRPPTQSSTTTATSSASETQLQDFILKMLAANAAEGKEMSMEDLAKAVAGKVGSESEKFEGAEKVAKAEKSSELEKHADVGKEEPATGRKLLSVSLLARPQRLYKSLWDAIAPHVRSAAAWARGDTPWSILIAGGRSALLAAKVAKRYPRAHVLALVHEADEDAAKEARRLRGSLALDNVVVLRGQLDARTASRLAASPDIVAVQVVGIDAVAPLLAPHRAGGEGADASLERLVAHYGNVLSLARVSFLELPGPETLYMAWEDAAHEHVASAASRTAFFVRFRGLLEAALASAELQGDVELLGDVATAAGGIVARVFLRSITRRVDVGCASADKASLTLRQTKRQGLKDRISATLTLADGSAVPLRRALTSVSLSFLIRAGLDSLETRHFFRAYLSLPPSRNMCPVNIGVAARATVGAILTHDPVGEAQKEEDNFHDDAKATAAAKSDALVAAYAEDADPALGDSAAIVERFLSDKAVFSLVSPLLEREGSASFSFMEYGSGDGLLSMLVARKFPNATVISLEADESRADAHYRVAESLGLHNNAVCHPPASTTAPSREIVTKLFESPEFLRFQYVRVEALVASIAAVSRGDVDTMLGQLLSTGLTTLVQVPSAATLSLAFSTFFPAFGPAPDSPADAADKSRFGRTTSGQATRYLWDSHPQPAFVDAERRLVGETTRADTSNTTVSANLLSPVAAGRVNSLEHIEDPGWRVVEVRLRNMSATVNHHFDYRVDGHSRKYNLQASSNETHWSVGLVRTKDGFRIPYESLSAVTLIAVLRMGLVAAARDRLYDLFLKLPLYEDMAPWNIVLRAGVLDYIDYDTRDRTFDKVVPLAYQVIAILMNYERTVKDFGRCKGKASTEYGFSYIASCVDSNFKGPCSNSAYPVPCGDGECKATYVDCLRSVAEIEAKRRTDAEKIGTDDPVRRMAADLEAQAAVAVGDEWTFDKNGPARHKEDKQLV